MTSALFIGRFQPFHNGHLDIIKKILSENDKIIIVIGSAQYSNSAKNPYNAKTRKKFIKDSLKETGITENKFEIIPVDDIHDLKNWALHIKKKTPPFQKLYTGSKIVKDCFLGNYGGPKILADEKITDIKKNLPISATQVRQAIKNNQDWEKIVPEAIAKIIKKC